MGGLEFSAVLTDLFMGISSPKARDSLFTPIRQRCSDTSRSILDRLLYAGLSFTSRSFLSAVRGPAAFIAIGSCILHVATLLEVFDIISKIFLSLHILSLECSVVLYPIEERYWHSHIEKKEKLYCDRLNHTCPDRKDPLYCSAPLSEERKLPSAHDDC